MEGGRRGRYQNTSEHRPGAFEQGVELTNAHRGLCNELVTRPEVDHK